MHKSYTLLLVACTARKPPFSTALRIYFVCGRITAMRATTLQQAFENLGTLPADLQDELGNQLKDYVMRWHALKADIEEGRAHDVLPWNVPALRLACSMIKETGNEAITVFR